MRKFAICRSRWSAGSGSGSAAMERWMPARASSQGRSLLSSRPSSGFLVKAEDCTKSTRKMFFNPDDYQPADINELRSPEQWQVDTRSSAATPQRWWNIDGRIREAIWTLHSQSPTKWDIQHLSDKFGLHTERIEAVLKLKRIEKEDWSPEDLHHDMEHAVESAIELYKLEHATSGLRDDHPEMEKLHAIYEIIYEFLTSVAQVEKLQAKLKKCAEEDPDRLSLVSQLTDARNTQDKSFALIRSKLRPDLSEPIEDVVVMNPAVDLVKSRGPRFDMAVHGKHIPLPANGPGSGSVIQSTEDALSKRHRPNRFRIVITDTSKPCTQKDLLPVIVREKDSSLRHATRNELERATQGEKCVKRDQRVLYSD